MDPSSEAKFSKPFVVLIVIICALPAVMHTLGLSFSLGVDPSIRGISGVHTEAIMARLGGPFALTILQWSAVVVSLFIAMLAFAHFNLARDVATPIIGVAFLFIGLIDAFQALTANRLINAMASNERFIPFAWATSRLIYAVIMLFGVGLATYRTDAHQRRDLRVIPLAAVVLAALAYGVVAYLATNPHLPQSMFPERWATRPYDILPLVVLIVCGVVIYPAFYRRLPSYFSHGLVLSAIPEIATQLYLVFGSSALYDNNFMVAYVLKVVACLVPLTGLMADYIHTYRMRADLEREVSQSRDSLRAVLHGVAEPIVAMNEQLIVLMANDAVSRVVGHRPSALVGQPLETILRASDQPNGELAAALENQSAALFDSRWPAVLLHEAGRVAHVELYFSKARVGGRILLIATLKEKGDLGRLDGASEFRAGLLDAVVDEVRLPLIVGLQRASDAAANGSASEGMDQVVLAQRTVVLALDEVVRFNRLSPEEAGSVAVREAIEDACSRADPAGRVPLSVTIDRPVPPVVVGAESALRLLLDAWLRDVLGAAGSDPVSIGVTCEGGDERMNLRVTVRFAPKRPEWWTAAIDTVSATATTELSSLRLATVGLVVAASAARTAGGGLEIELQGSDKGLLSATFPCAAGAASLGASPSEAAALDRSLRVLLVDSSADHELVVRRALEAHDIEVQSVGDGCGGHELFVRDAFDCVLVDADLIDQPVSTFVEELRRIEVEASQEPVLVVVFSRQRRRRALGELRQFGVEQVLDKPVDLRQLLRIVAQIARVDTKTRPDHRLAPRR
ncbi:MAG: hypothetical protein KC609_24110 [Myxococcales bacterium]|nr:hypothetical protein [Myxococcales bacterium]